MIMIRVLLAEIAKLKGSLVLLLASAPPAMMLVMIPAVILSGNGPDEWRLIAMNGAAIWAYLLMPLTATALTALLAGLEHQSGGWTWTLAQPVPKPLIFAAKAIVSAGLMALISVGIAIGILVGGSLAGALSPDQALGGPLPLARLADLLSRMFGASLFALAIQFAVAHAFRAFAVPIIVGIGGTFVAVVATSAQAGIYFPWLLAVNMLASDPARAQQALTTGLVGGVIVFGVSCFWLARRDWR
jgi:hypothetical protein